jgi:hypothetical protein
MRPSTVPNTNQTDVPGRRSSTGVSSTLLPGFFNPIKEFFSELKQFIKRRWNEYEENPGQGFDAFLEWCVRVVGSRVQSAKGHFRHAGIQLEEVE